MGAQAGPSYEFTEGDGNLAERGAGRMNAVAGPGSTSLGSMVGSAHLSQSSDCLRGSLGLKQELSHGGGVRGGLGVETR